MQYLAIWLIFLMLALFTGATYASSVSSNVSWLYLRAFAEAALVGGLADWFAVVALFRHPLGIPIPHTAILSRKKNRIGEALASFIRENFLTDNAIRAKVVAIGPSQKIVGYLSIDENNKKVARKVSELVGEVLDSSSDTVIAQFVAKVIDSAAQRGLNISRLAGSTLEMLLQIDRSEVFSRGLLGLFSRLLVRHDNFLRRSFGAAKPWYVPRFIESHLYRSFVSKFGEALTKVSSEDGAVLREALRHDLGALASFLKEDNRAAQVGTELGKWLVSSTELQTSLKQLATAIAERNSEHTPVILAELLKLFAETLRNSPEIQSRVDEFTCIATQQFFNSYADELLRIISDTIKQWDAKTFIEKLELQLWQDLQFIRINGTLVGGLIGIVLFSFGRLFSN